MPDNIPPLPPGFTLDQQEIPPLPPGFTLDQSDEPMPAPDRQAYQDAAQRPRTRTEAVMRQLGLTARAVAGGAAQAVEPFTNPVRNMMNLVPGVNIPRLEESTDQLLTQAGVAEPENAIERGVQTVGRFASGVAAGTGISNAAARGMGIAAAPKPSAEPPTTDKLRQYANRAYQRADDAGVIIRPESFRGVVDDVQNAVREAGYNAKLHPRVSAALDDLSAAADEPLTFKNAEILRRIAKNAAASNQADERRIAGLVIEKLDDYVGALGPDDVITGDARTASTAINQARNLWGRMSKGEMIEDMVDRAATRAKGQFSGSGFENGLRTEFRQLVMNKKRMRLFTPEEQAALKRVAEGGPIGNALRLLGKLAPTGVVSGGIGSGAGYAIAGAPGAVAVPAMGVAARKGAEYATLRNVANASELMRRAVPIAPPAQNALAPLVPGISAVGPANALYRRRGNALDERD